MAEFSSGQPKVVLLIKSNWMKSPKAPAIYTTSIRNIGIKELP
jgi:hypothetical protein